MLQPLIESNAAACAQHKHDCMNSCNYNDLIHPLNMPGWDQALYCRNHCFHYSQEYYAIASLLTIHQYDQSSNRLWQTIYYHKLNQISSACLPIVATTLYLIKSFTPDFQWFPTLHISSVFLLIPMEPKPQYKFAFTFDGQQVTWTYLPQGFHSPPFIFHRQMKCVVIF